MSDGSRSTAVVVDGRFVPVRPWQVAAVPAEDELVLVDEATGELHLLNSTAALLWQCFDGESSVSAICADIAEVLGVPFERALRDTVTAVQDLIDRGMLSDRPTAAPAPDVPRKTEPTSDGLEVLVDPPDT